MLSLVLSSCKSTRKVVGDSGKAAKETLLELSKTQKLDYDRVTISGKASYDSPDDGVSMSVNYRLNMIADSLIWIRISKFGFEGARVLITSDSVNILDHTAQELKMMDIQGVESMIGMQANLSMLQSMLLGEMYLAPEIQSIEMRKDTENPVIFDAKTKDLEIAYSIDPLIQRLVALEAYHQAKSMRSKVSYSEFQEVGNTQLPDQTKIIVSDPKELSIDFKHNKVDINPSKFSVKFSIPEHYERKAY